MHKGYPKFFVQAIRRNFPRDFAEIMDKIEREYDRIAPQVAFARHSTNPIDRRLDFSAYFLATILVLDSWGRSFDEIRSICLEIVLDYVQPRSALHAWIKRLVPKLIGKSWTASLLTAFGRRVNARSHPDGFRAEILTDKAETYGLGYGVNILECGICKLFNRNGLAKYAPILCEVDRATSGLAGLELIRAGTIANGAGKCDFRWKRL